MRLSVYSCWDKNQRLGCSQNNMKRNLSIYTRSQGGNTPIIDLSSALGIVEDFSYSKKCAFFVFEAPNTLSIRRNKCAWCFPLSRVRHTRNLKRITRYTAHNDVNSLIPRQTHSPRQAQEFKYETNLSIVFMATETGQRRCAVQERWYLDRR